MATGKPTVFYWDTAPLIAWIKDEKRPDKSEMDGLAEVVDLFDRSKAVIVTSVLWRAEIFQSALTPKQRDKLLQAFEVRAIQEVGIDGRIMDLVSEIRSFHKNDTSKGSKSRLKNIRVPDAIHLATAILYEVDEFHTFDGKKSGNGVGGLITLNGNVAGHKLKICSPRANQLRLDYGSPDDDAE
jgi:predicted nucleic acid-binding protein